jgi:hypothetical protein
MLAVEDWASSLKVVLGLWDSSVVGCWVIVLSRESARRRP